MLERVLAHLVQQALVVITECRVAYAIDLCIIDLDLVMQESTTDERLPNGEVVVVCLAENGRFREPFECSGGLSSRQSLDRREVGRVFLLQLNR